MACLILNSKTSDAGSVDGLQKHGAACSCVCFVFCIESSGWDMEGRKTQGSGKVRDDGNRGVTSDLSNQRPRVLSETKNAGI